MRIAILDDDISQTDHVKQILEADGHICHAFHNGGDLLNRLRRETYDLLILDLLIPDIRGEKVLEWVRTKLKATLPVILITNLVAEMDVVNGLNAGADDYIVKPLRNLELVARVNAVLRRTYPLHSPQEASYTFENYEFDVATLCVKHQNKTIQLTQKEFNLALFFFRNLTRPLSRAHVMDMVWGREMEVPTRTIDTHVSRVRSKLNLRPENGFRLTPVYSYGYRLEKIQPE